MLLQKKVFPLIFFIGLFWGACTEVKQPDKIYLKSIIDHRVQKDSLFSVQETSPMPESILGNFSGLPYFDIDEGLRFEGPISEFKSVEIDTILGTKGDKRPAQKYGYFQFQHLGQEYRLVIYKMLSSKPGYEDYLFLGFFDKNAGHSTYGGGRYIDLVLNQENHYVVDFNLAYNPYCAYNDRFSCAVPPLENQLSFAVNAGEKNWVKH